MAANSVDSDQYVDGSIDTAHIADDAVTADKIGPITGDVFFDCQGNAGRDILWDDSDAALEFSDDTQLTIGDGKDLTLKHNGSHSYIQSTTGSLLVESDSCVLRSTGQENYLVGTANGSVDIYHNSSKKFETTANGITVTGRIDAAADSTHDIGTSSVRFANGYFDTVYGDGSNLTNLPASGKASNLFDNGAFQIAQRGPSSDSGGKQTVDRWWTSDNNMNVTITQSQHALTSSDSGPWALGFRYSYKIAFSAAGNSLDGSSYVEFLHFVESGVLSRSGWDYTSASSNITFSFWFKASTNATFYASLKTGDGDAYSYPFSFTASGNDTWTKITKTIPGNSNIQINNDEGIGMQFRIIPYYGADSTDSGKSLNAWSAHTNAAFTPDFATTWATSTNPSFEITGCLLEVADSASDYPHLKYGEELLICQRYYYRTFANNNEFFPGMGMADTDGNTVILNTQFPVRMRTAPTALEQTGTASDYKIRRSTNATCTSVPAFGHATKDQAATNFISSSHGFGDGSAVRCMSAGTDHHLAWSADL
tara:strand:- start:374 stop:1987 length:1614 start_codon:yes stop_codon:yes gene_type:complete